MTGLASDSARIDRVIAILETMPEYRTAKNVFENAERESKQAEEDAYNALHVHCGGAPSARITDIGYECPLCGLLLKYRDYAAKSTMESVIHGEHWIHVNGGNPARKDGLSGKSAQAADGDWYGSH